MSKNDDLVRTAQTSVRDHIRTIAARLMEGDRRLTIVHPLPSIGTSYYPPEIAKEVGELLADAIERGAAQGVWVKQLEWKGPFKPGENGSHYDHIYADSALGRYAFEWKSWKGYDSPTSADCPGDFFYAANDLNDAKAAAQADYEQRIMSALDTATPPAPAPDAGEEECPASHYSELADRLRQPYVSADDACEAADILDSLPRSSPTPQPPAVEAEGVEPVAWFIDKGEEGFRVTTIPRVAEIWTDQRAKVEPLIRATTLKAKTDEIERLTKKLAVTRQEADCMREQSIENSRRHNAAEASNKALREGLKGTLDAWEMLPEGYHRIHAIQSWLADNMQPAIARARSLLGGE